MRERKLSLFICKLRLQERNLHTKNEMLKNGDFIGRKPKFPPAKGVYSERRCQTFP